ncbi:FkbM family methyltransferase [Maridesulfovibrio sp. FT414]|uniref:FkbM family methyltransferase n=1 Tax=Maridesulfovibrio sp. FT414 TaxID=2979469 RepID=UPI003D808303
MTYRHIKYTHYSEVPPNSKICIYGVGQGGTLTYEMLTSLRPDLNIAAFADTYKTGVFQNIPILSPEELSNYNSSFDLILICSSYATEIRDILEENQITNYFFFSWPRLHSCQFLPEELQHAQNKIQRIVEHLHSQNDKDLFLDLVEFRSINSKIASIYTGTENQPIINLNDSEFLNNKYPKHTSARYFDFTLLETVQNVVQGGVCNGREAVFIIQNCPQLVRIFGFEAFGTSLLDKKHSEILLNSDKFFPINKGLWESSGQFIFSTLGEIINDSKSITEGTSVKVCSLDNESAKLGLDRLDLLFCDIENSELPMLKGAINLIKKSRTQLAISFYHSKHQFLDIPLFLIDNLENYIFKVGHYEPHIGDSVFYAIPKEVYSGHQKYLESAIQILDS